MNKQAIKDRVAALSLDVFSPFEWPSVGLVMLKSLTESEVSALSTSVAGQSGKFGSVLLAATVYDASLTPVFNVRDPDDFAMLLDMPMSQKRAALDEAMRINGLGGQAQAQALGNSPSPDASAGASPSPSDSLALE